MSLCEHIIKHKADDILITRFKFLLLFEAEFPEI